MNSARSASILVVLGVAATSAVWFVCAPHPIRASDVPVHQADIANGRNIFWAGGCASCHAAPGARGDAKLVLEGGVRLKTRFGVFRSPNISPDPVTGIGGWTDLQFLNAMQRGVAPDGRHYFPAFPYTSYTRMRSEDILDLKAFLDTLTPVKKAIEDHSLMFPFNIRRGVGAWKLLYMRHGPVVGIERENAQIKRGRYLVEGVGHCGECHTPRDILGGMDYSRWLSGARVEDEVGGEEIAPNITGGEGGIADWSEDDIVHALETGFTPSHDSFDDQMSAVQKNLAHLPIEDCKAIAAYLKAILPHPNGYPAKKLAAK